MSADAIHPYDEELPRDDAPVSRGTSNAWKTEDFDFKLPEHLIAQRPSLRRGGSRLMCLPPEGDPHFTMFDQIAQLFRGDEVLILNDTKVVPARLHGHKETGGRVEIFFLEPHEQSQFWAMTRGKLKPGHRVVLPLGAEAVMLERDAQGRALFELELPTDLLNGSARPELAIWAWLEEAGKLPLPPYIQRDPDEDDRTRYQTIFAKAPGAVAAPTAGLHFTDELITALKLRGVQIGYVTLHVGAGTFLPVKSEALEDHVMHHERYSVPRETQALLRAGRPIVAVGTTVVRALESFMALTEENESHWDTVSEQSTDIFISPGYQWRVVDGLITNFHLPQSTLLMLVSAFAGYERTMHAYRRAVDEGLMFYSYGDSSIFWRPRGRWHRESESS